MSAHPWHNAPPCPHCKATVVTPAARRSMYAGTPPSAQSDVQAMYCPACGESWHEMDTAIVAQAWWSTGAHEAKLLLGDSANGAAFGTQPSALPADIGLSASAPGSPVARGKGREPQAGDLGTGGGVTGEGGGT